MVERIRNFDRQAGLISTLFHASVHSVTNQMEGVEEEGTYEEDDWEVDRSQSPMRSSDSFQHEQEALRNVGNATGESYYAAPNNITRNRR